MVEKALSQSAVLIGSVKHTCANLTKFGHVKLRVASVVSNLALLPLTETSSAYPKTPVSGNQSLMCEIKALMKGTYTLV